MLDIDGWDPSRLKIRKRRHVYSCLDWIIVVVVKNGAVAELISRTHLGSTRASKLFRDFILRNHLLGNRIFSLIKGRRRRQVVKPINN